MKKILAFFMATLTVLSCSTLLIACGGDDVTTTSSTTGTTTVGTTTTTTVGATTTTAKPPIVLTTTEKPQQEQPSEAIEYLKWDGKVAGTDKTLREIMDGTEIVRIEALDTLLDFDPNTKVIKTPQGLALLSAYINGKVQISDWDANAYAKFWGAHFKLGANMDLSGHEWVPIGKNEASNTTRGIFDGQGYVITGMTINVPSLKEQLKKTPGAVYYGLFGRFKADGDFTFQNISLINSSITVNNDTGDVSEGGVDAYLGGLVAYIGGNMDKKVTIKDCVVACDITAIASGAGTATQGFDNSEAQVVIGGVGAWTPYNMVAFENVVYAGEISTGEHIAAGALTCGGNGPSFSATGILTLAGNVPLLQKAKNVDAAVTVKNVYGTAVTGDNANAWSAADGSGFATLGAATTVQNAVSGSATVAFLLSNWIQPQAGLIPIPAPFFTNAVVIARALELAAPSKTA